MSARRRVRAARFYGDLRSSARTTKPRFSTAERATIVLGDIPPLAFAAAARAGVPSVAIGNFTWDWIYDGIRRRSSAIAPGVIDTIRDAYATATRALRLPLHGGFDADGGGHDRHPVHRAALDARRADTRRAWACRTIVRSCWRHSAAADSRHCRTTRSRDAERLTVLAPEREPPAPLTYQDLVAAADVVVSKPGYGIVSECVANGTPLLYTSRGRFVEYDVFVAEMPRVLRCRYLAAGGSPRRPVGRRGRRAARAAAAARTPRAMERGCDAICAAESMNVWCRADD